MKKEELPLISENEIISGDRILIFFLNRIGFDKPNKLITLIALIVVPFLLTTIAAKYESRFKWGDLSEIKEIAYIDHEEYIKLENEFPILKEKFSKSCLIINTQGDEKKVLINIENLSEKELGQKVTEKIKRFAQKKRIIGMSYLGDPMVWPFYILVPLALIFLGISAQRIEKFFSKIRNLINLTFISKESDTYDNLINEAKVSFASKDKWKWLKYSGLVAGIVLILYNAITCTFPEVFHPYTSNEVYICGQEEPIYLINKIVLPKWDTDIKKAPFCWLLSRLWVFLGYGLIPIILSKLINLTGVVYVFCNKLTQEKERLRINPLSADKAGGFSCLSDLAISFVYVTVPFLLMVLAQFLKEATPPSFHNYILVISFIPIFSLVFFLPLISFHEPMKRVKETYLFKISKKYNEFNEKLLTGIEEESIPKDKIEQYEKYLDLLKNMYNQVEDKPVWPTEIKTFYTYIMSFSLPPLFTFLLQNLLKK